MKFLFRYLSYIIGFLARLKRPAFLAKLAVRIYANYYNANLSEASKSLDEYACVADFFNRQLKVGSRPIEEGVVSPADAVLRGRGEVVDFCIPQVKGKHYFLNEFMGDAAKRNNVRDLYYVNLYLSPSDYHHVHVPVDSILKAIDYIPGFLWPVNDWSLNNVPNLFSRNERVVFTFESSLGKYYLIMIAATNVGDISLAFDRSLSHRLYGLPWEEKTSFLKEYSIDFKKGDELASFLLGSSVVLLFNKNAVKAWSKSAANNQHIKYGESLFAG